MSGAFRERKTVKTKSALNLFYAVFFAGNSKGQNGNNSFKQIIINRRAG